MKSMTGFGRSETATEKFKLVVEMKAVNHRYCDIGIKLPKMFNKYEAAVRAITKEYASRGKIDIYISFEDHTEQRARVDYNEAVARGYMDAIERASKVFGIEKAVTAVSLIHMPEVVTLKEEDLDVEDIYPALEETLRRAAQRFLDARCKEGAHLKADLLDKLAHIEELVRLVEERSPQMVEEYRRKISDKVRELLGDKSVDERILATELTVYADKVCVDEETVRLCSHTKNMRDTMEQGEAVGRKLDFIAQEMNREANTILSKVNDRELLDIAIDLKTEIEKVREQIQNIE